MSLSSLEYLNAMGKASSRAHTFSDTGATLRTGKQVSVVPLLTLDAFLALEPVKLCVSQNNVSAEDLMIPLRENIFWPSHSCCVKLDT